jgi:hypothetical protein
MKTGKAGDLLGVDGKTLKNWIDMGEFTKFFSDSAMGKHGRPQRDLTESDLLVLNTIRVQRTSGNTNWQAIVELLETGYRDTDLPAAAMTVDTGAAPLQQYLKALGTAAEKDAALALIRQKDAEIERLVLQVEKLEKEKIEIKEALLRELEREKMELMRAFLREIGDLREEIGRLKGQLGTQE